ncbi:ABC transporter ATP-binding protein [Lentzea sp. NPDC051213]|uniref:ABC transporter ATP-binding protein n=1 Tax=Lentzea sp. NPDC051213 TaxID=3364126 RepID=UPI0037AA29FB
MTRVIELSGVSKVYAGEVHALRAVDLSVDAGELLAVVGPSGSGKSTLLQLMGTLDRPTSGTVRLLGHDVATLDDRALSAVRAHWVGFVFQRFFLTSHLSALGNVANGLLYQGEGSAERGRRAKEALHRVGLGHRIDHLPSELSGGEQQRVAIARALVGRPAIVLADEPTGALDSSSGQAVLDLLHELNAEGTTIAVITHDLAVARSLPRQVEVLDGAVRHDSARRPA